MRKQLPVYYSMSFGCDPELFLSMEVGKVRKRQRVVGSDVIVPAKGLLLSGGGAVVRDGAQVELHPYAESCRASQSNYITKMFDALLNGVQAKNKEMNLNIKIDMRPVVKLTPSDLLTLSPEARRLGCMPSFNAYGRKNIERDGAKYLWRSAAGHIHMGSAVFASMVREEPGFADAFAKVCDVVIGIPGVLIDRHPLASFRRKTYGRAGEYRLPKHGFEYRTLSNFWLHHCTLHSLFMGLALTAFNIGLGKKSWSNMGGRGIYYRPENYLQDPGAFLFEKIDPVQVEQAINTNDWDLAYEIYTNSLLRLLQVTVPLSKGLTGDNIEHFDLFVKEIRKAELAGMENPLNRWFKDDPVSHWVNKGDGHGRGWESFCSRDLGYALTDSKKSSIVGTFSGGKYYHVANAQGIMTETGNR